LKLLSEIDVSEFPAQGSSALPFDNLNNCSTYNKTVRYLHLTANNFIVINSDNSDFVRDLIIVEAERSRFTAEPEIIVVLARAHGFEIILE